MRPEMLKMSRAYLAMGLPIIPLCSYDHEGMFSHHKETCSNPGKRPLIKDWQSWNETTSENFKEWLDKYGEFNIGLPLGSASGYVGIDVDGAEGEEILRERSQGDLPDTWEFTTGAGRRLLYQIPLGMETKKFKQAGSGEHTECALLCTGQQTVLPPSIHHTGRMYMWTVGHTPDVIDCAEAPAWLIRAIQVTKEEKIERKRAKIVLDLSRPDAMATAFNPVEGNNDLTIELPLEAEVTEASSKGRGRHKATISEEDLNRPLMPGERDNMMTRIIGHYMATAREHGYDAVLAICKAHNQKWCDPPLSDEAIEAKVRHFWESEEIKQAAHSSRNASGGREAAEEWSPIEVAQMALNVMEEDGLCLKIQDQGDVVWVCHTTYGPWKSYDARSSNFQSFFYSIVTDPERGGKPSYSTINKMRDISHAICMTLRQQGRIWSVDKNSLITQSLEMAKLIPLTGGKLLDWETGTLLPWDPDTNFTYVLPIEYNPNETCPNWEKRLEEWLPEKESRMLIQEFIGYSLIPYMGFEKALLLLGGGANGKSIFLDTIQGMLGNEVTDAVNMRMLFSNFGPQYLEGKILNIANEAASDFLKNSMADEFKNLVSGGLIRADVKKQAARHFANTAKFIFSTNNDTKTSDKSEGWARRLITIPFTQSFLNSETPKYVLMEELRKEYPGIFNWAIEGLRRLMTNGKFTESAVVEERKQKYLAGNDVPEDFFQNCLEIVTLKEVGENEELVLYGLPTSTVNELFEMWIEYRESNVQKKKAKLKEYLEDKKGIQRIRSDKFYNGLVGGKTLTWRRLRLNIRDEEFLEYVRDEGSAKLREYCIKQLNKLNDPA